LWFRGGSRAYLDATMLFKALALLYRYKIDMAECMLYMIIDKNNDMLTAFIPEDIVPELSNTAML